MKEVWKLMWLLVLLMAARRSPAQVLPEMDDLFIAAVKEGRAHSVHELLTIYRSYININYENKNREFPLYIASKSGYSEVVEVLLQNSYLDINRRHDNGSTALWIASAGEHYGVVQLLLEHPGTNLTKGMADNQDKWPSRIKRSLPAQIYSFDIFPGSDFFESFLS